MIEFFLFCADDRRLPVAEIMSTLRDAGWSLRVARNWLGSDGFQLIDDGYLDTNDVTIGWPNDSDLASEFDTALSRGDRKQLDKWICDYQLGYAMWAFQSPYNFTEHSEFGSVEDAREQMGEQFADHLAQTKCMYLVTNCPHMAFTAIVLGAAAMLRNGMIEDPQMGSCIPAPRNASELSIFLETWTG